MLLACPLWFMSNGENVHFVILIIEIGYSEIKVICSLIIANTLLFIKVQYLYIYASLFMYLYSYCIFIQDIGTKRPVFRLAESTISDQVS